MLLYVCICGLWCQGRSIWASLRVCAVCVHVCKTVRECLCVLVIVGDHACMFVHAQGMSMNPPPWHMRKVNLKARAIPWSGWDKRSGKKKSVIACLKAPSALNKPILSAKNIRLCLHGRLPYTLVQNSLVLLRIVYVPSDRSKMSNCDCDWSYSIQRKTSPPATHGEMQVLKLRVLSFTWFKHIFTSPAWREMLNGQAVTLRNELPAYTHMHTQGLHSLCLRRHFTWYIFNSSCSVFVCCQSNDPIFAILQHPFPP